MMTTNPYQPGARILAVAHEHPDRVALVIDSETWTYAELLAAVQGIAKSFPIEEANGRQPITAVMAQRHISSYAGILAARLAGHAYVPLNVNHPCQRNATILRTSGAQRVICGTRAAETLANILDTADMTADDIDRINCGDRQSDYDTVTTEQWRKASPRDSSVSDLAYILFTSGSTGNPKGVPIQNAQLEAYLAAAGPLVDPQTDDRFSQTFDLTFDLSVHDLFVCWENGATLVVPSAKELRMPAAFINEQRISCWFSVPSLAYQMRLQEDLTAGAFPGLRHSIFCGEALPTLVAREWAKAAPNSVVENWYGPTEATIACSRFAITSAPIDDDTVPIGVAFSGMELLIQDEELLLAGAQLATGYLNDAEKTAASFVTLADGKAAYRTGDRAALGADGNMRFLGRVDNQVKVRGYRIELGEIEAALRQASAGLNSVALAWPGGAEIATTIVAALETNAADTAAFKKALKAVLPEYMVPSMIFCVPEFPKNASGKMDRKALAEMLQSASLDDTDSDTDQLSAEAKTLMQAIKTFAPLLSTRNILQARNLFDAGMDSLAFVSVTTEIEHSLGLSLDQDSVILLAEMSFDEIVAEAQGKTDRLATTEVDDEALSVFDRVRRFFGIPRIIKKPRANRALQFIERFPDYLAKHGVPDILAVGSSGTFRAICPDEFGDNVTVLNAGFPAISAAGMPMMCKFIKQQCDARQLRVPLIIYEFDPMHVSTVPPSGDINLGPDFFNGGVVPLRGANTSLEFQWLADNKGAWTPSEKVQQKGRKPNWARNRDRVIAAAYLGDIEFDSQAVEHWYAGARDLHSICDRMVCFVHPVDKAMTDEISDECGSDNLRDFIAAMSDRLGIEILPWTEFDLVPDDYLDVNHMNARGGREKLSRQLAQMILR
ncbi:MAG: non-ribosomal peptide synthetase [Woeseiaceae bacterium]